MIAFSFTFSAGRYHATPWGSHANEASVAWPPEPVTLLRALIATWWRKGEQERFPKETLCALIDSLAAKPPHYHLPEKVVHAHSRAYMPIALDKKRKTRLIYDAFLRLENGAELVFVWPDETLEDEQMALATHLLERIGYLGRAESWVEGRVRKDWCAKRQHLNSCPSIESNCEFEPVKGFEPVSVTLPKTPKEWISHRESLMTGLDGMAGFGGKKGVRKRKMIDGILHKELTDALSVENGEWQQAGWMLPPSVKKMVYYRPIIESHPPIRTNGQTKGANGRTRIQSGNPEVARFVLAGRPPPRIEKSLRIGEIARGALMSGGGQPPEEFSGRNKDGPLCEDSAHAHAFFLPEDADDDGCIDHLIIFCRKGFSEEACKRLDGLRKLWLPQKRGATESGSSGREEWSVALEGIAAVKDFPQVSALLQDSKKWVSVTPYLMPWHAKRNFGVAEQITRELERRDMIRQGVALKIKPLPEQNVRRFMRFRKRRKLVQPDRSGCFLEMTFPKSVCGPISLGFACHYGLGLFKAAG